MVFIYEVNTKVLERRLCKVVGVVGGWQYAFMDNKKILDAALITNEVIDSLLRSGLKW